MERKLFKSAIDKTNSIHSLDYVEQWLVEQRQRVEVNVEQIAFEQLGEWVLNSESLSHTTGKFFSIRGIDVKTNYGSNKHWQQPIIDQPEIGYLGIICKEINGVLHFLMQAKIEPGNINYVQLSPTLQATKSNYTKVHKGKSPDYLDVFRNSNPEQIVFDQLQSEQGARFLKKRNRNILLLIEEEIELKENFIWLTLAQIKELMRKDNRVNMDTRTVVSGISFESIDKDLLDKLSKNIQAEKSNDNFRKGLINSLYKNSNPYHSLTEIIAFITEAKCNYELDVKVIDLASVENWVVGNDSIYHKDNRFFEVIACNINISNREVMSWNQPLVKPQQQGICAFVCKNINGLLHFAVQAKLECGNFDIIELAPTVQCLTGNYNTPHSISRLPFLNYVLNAKEEQIVFDTMQSEEGGRFYREQNRNLIVMAGDEVEESLPKDFIWMTYGQLQTFIKHNNYINIQARSLLAAIEF